ncbi:MAG TPA: methionine biosynthesis protein MetW [Candidatus Dormibacteraeota bacterium]
MLSSCVARIQQTVSNDARVLDVGAWGKPFTRADWVLDHMPYESRGLYGRDGDGDERFSAATWVVRDICDREPWPFADKSIDFAICSHTLEDVRDPVWVCSELVRVARAGYIEVPSRLVEQAWGIQGDWTGWGHHHWLVDVGPRRIDFVFKHHIVQAGVNHFPAGYGDTLSPEETVQSLWWERDFDYRERIFTWPPAEIDRYLADFVASRLREHPMPPR